MKLLIITSAFLAGPVLAWGAKSKATRFILIGLSLYICTLIALVMLAQADCSGGDHSYINCSHLSDGAAAFISSAFLLSLFFGRQIIITFILLAGFFEYRTRTRKA